MTTRSYEGAGVGGQEEALSALHRHLGDTLSLPEEAEVLTGFGHFASVLKLSGEIAVALTTDGVGSKTIVASMLDRYDTIGFDCVAMNVNDLLCVGAHPVALVDYVGVNTLDRRRAEEIMKGLAAAAKEAGIAIPGGEIAQLPDIIGPTERDFDLVGTSIGIVHPARLALGERVLPGDAVVGLSSSGLHSNGYTLVRRVLNESRRRVDELIRPGVTLGDALLEPTLIYVRAVKAIWDAGIDTKGIAHITGDGFFNLCRLNAKVGYALHALPDPHDIFALVQELGSIDDAEMYRVFNMGVGLAVVTPEEDAERAVGVAAEAGYAALRIGTIVDEPGTVRIEPRALMGTFSEGRFRKGPLGPPC